MATFQYLWSRLLRVLGMRGLGAQWVEPGNAITRSVTEGAPLATMASWAEPAPEVALAVTPSISSQPRVEPEKAKDEPAARKGVAA